MTPGGLFRQDSDRLGHGKNFFRAPEGVPKYTKKAKSARGRFNYAMYKWEGVGYGIILDLFGQIYGICDRFWGFFHGYG